MAASAGTVTFCSFGSVLCAVLVLLSHKEAYVYDVFVVIFVENEALGALVSNNRCTSAVVVIEGSLAEDLAVPENCNALGIRDVDSDLTREQNVHAVSLFAFAHDCRRG